MKCEAYLLLRAIGRFRFLQPTTTALHKYSEQVIGKYNHLYQYTNMVRLPNSVTTARHKNECLLIIIFVVHAKLGSVQPSQSVFTSLFHLPIRLV